MAVKRHPILGRLGVWRRRGFLGLTPAALAAAGVACGPSAPQAQGTPQAGQQGKTQDPGTPQKGGVFTEAVFGDAKTMQPLLSSDSASSSFISNHYSASLFRYDPETLKPDTKYGAADAFQVSPDGMTVTYKLKANLQWSDGKPITAADYKFTWDKMNDPKVEYPYRSNLRFFESMETTDDKTLVFKLKEAFCPAVEYSNINPIPKHIFQDLDINDNPLNQKPAVGSGPWLMQEWVKDSHAVFVANDKFYLGRPNFDRHVYRIVADQNVIYQMLKASEVDEGGIKAEDWAEAKALKNINTYNYYSASASWVYIGTYMKHEALSDVRVRQALAHSINRPKMVERIRFNLAKPLNSIFASSSWAFAPDVPAFNFDVAKGNQLLDQAGWRRPASDANGTRVKDGKPLKMRIFYNAGNKEREQIATVVQQDAKAIGMDLEVISEEWNAYLNRVQKTHDVELFVLGWSSGLEPNGSQNIWRTDQAQNYTGFSDPKVDELFPKAAAIPGCSQDDRKKMYADIQKVVAPQVPYIFLWENEILGGVSNRIVVNKMSKIGYSYRMWEWYSKTGK